MRSKIILGLSFVCILITVAFAEDTLTITTYYPSPHGVYNRLQTNSLGVGDNDNDGSLDSGDVPSTNGDVWIKGNVGIGTTTPNENLHIHASSSSADIQLTDSTSGTTTADGFQLGFIWSNAYFINQEAGHIFFKTSGLDRVAIDSEGYVGIGTMDPQAQLDVNGPIKCTGTGGNVPHDCFQRESQGSAFTINGNAKQFAVPNPCSVNQLINPLSGYCRIDPNTYYPVYYISGVLGGTNNAYVGCDSGATTGAISFLCCDL